MPQEYKVRLGDGSEIGPMSLQSVRDWHRQGLLEAKSGVLRPGSKRWTTLDQVLEPQAFGKSSGSKTSPPPPPPTAARRERDDVRGPLVSVDPRKLGLAAAALLVVVGMGAGYRFFTRDGPAKGTGESLAATPDPLDALVRQAVQTATTEVPVLTPAAAQLLMERSQARIMEPDQLFRRSLEALTRAQPSWSAGEVREVGQITNALYANLSGRDRTRLAAYIDRVRGRLPTTTQEDREMCGLMKNAVLHLPAPMRQRLQAFYEKAVRAAA
jgi:hypothetical protein